MIPLRLLWYLIDKYETIRCRKAYEVIAYIRILILVLYTYRNRIVITLCLDRFSVFHRAVKMVEKEKAPSKEIPIDPLQHKSSLTSVDDIEENNVCV